jgi:hypothetical protein
MAVKVAVAVGASAVWIADSSAAVCVACCASSAADGPQAASQDANRIIEITLWIEFFITLSSLSNSTLLSGKSIVIRGASS